MAFCKAQWSIFLDCSGLLWLALWCHTTSISKAQASNSVSAIYWWCFATSAESSCTKKTAERNSLKNLKDVKEAASLPLADITGKLPCVTELCFQKRSAHRLISFQIRIPITITTKGIVPCSSSKIMGACTVALVWFFDDLSRPSSLIRSSWHNDKVCSDLPPWNLFAQCLDLQKSSGKKPLHTTVSLKQVLKTLLMCLLTCLHTCCCWTKHGWKRARSWRGAWGPQWRLEIRYQQL